MKRTGSGKSSGRSSAKRRVPAKCRKKPAFVARVGNDGYEVSLEIGKVYVTLPDPDAAKAARICVIDQSEEDDLFPVEYFLPLERSKPARQAFAKS